MDVMPEISFRHMPHDNHVEDLILDRIDQLEKFHHHLTSCRVVVEHQHPRRRFGNLYHVRIEMGVPGGGELVVSRARERDDGHRDPVFAVNDAFRRAKRQLDEFQRVQAGDVKRHEEPTGGVVSALFPRDGYGMITTADGREVYFHRNAAGGKSFEQFEVGEEVRFAEEAGEKGPQATSVRPVGRHHHLEMGAGSPAAD